MSSHDFIVIFIGFISEVVGTISGFGSSTYFVPLALFFEKFTFVLTLTAFLHSFSNIFKVILFRRSFDRGLFLRLAVPSVGFCAVGALLVPTSNLNTVKLILGILLMLFSLIKFLGIFRNHRISSGQVVILGSVSGLLTGLLGTGGALRGLALTALNIEKESFVFLSSGIDLGGDLLRLLLYLRQGYMEWQQWYYIPLLLVAASAGTHLGKKILEKIPQKAFQKTVIVFTFASGALLAFNSVKDFLK